MLNVGGGGGVLTAMGPPIGTTGSASPKQGRKRRGSSHHGWRANFDGYSPVAELVNT